MLPWTGLTAAPEPIIEDCGLIAARMERVAEIPTGLLQALALAESARFDPDRGDSRPWPWTVRSGPDSFYLPSKDLALDKVRELQAAGHTNIDVGCMQINLGFHPAAFASLEEAFDPLRNVAYGARFLLELRAETRSWAIAAGRYHSADPDRGQAYRARVWHHWRDLRHRQGGEPPMFGETAFVGQRLARLTGGEASPASVPGARLIVPSALERTGRVAVLRGRPAGPRSAATSGDVAPAASTP